MTTTEEWKNNKCCCGCGNVITDDDTFYKIGNVFYCKSCGSDKTDAVECQYADGAVMELITRKSFSSLHNGFYRLRFYKGNILIKESLDSADNAKIRELTDNGSYVLEKRIEGFMLRFSTGAYCHSEFFDLLDYEYEELDNIISRQHERNLRLICEGEFVIGISVVPRVGIYKNSFACYEQSFVLAAVGNVGSEKDNTKEPVVSKSETTAVKPEKTTPKISPADMLSYFEKRLIGQQTEVRKIVYLFCEYLRMAKSGSRSKAPNWVLTAPSGCGKTEVYRILRDYFRDKGVNIPVLQIDLSQFSESGYKGKDADELIDIIADANEQGDGTAIVFLDEADKKFTPSIGSAGIDHNAAAQANLLTIIEGSRYDKTKRGQPKRIIDTGKTMFVLMGAFQAIRSSRQKKRPDKRTIGFGTAYEKSTDDADRFYDDISINDMIEYGMLEELAGRMEQVINLHRLSEEDMKYLIREKARLVSEETGVAIELDDGAVNSFLDIAYTNLGVRNVTNRIRGLVCEAVSTVYYNEDFDPSSCTVWIVSPDDAMIGVADNDMFCEIMA